MRKRMLVCQFASPLDVDIHSKPEAVVLEGKYWKRQFDVIKAEYMKWRKFHRNRGLGNQSIMDTVEFNFSFFSFIFFYFFHFQKRKYQKQEHIFQ